MYIYIIYGWETKIHVPVTTNQITISSRTRPNPDQRDPSVPLFAPLTAPASSRVHLCPATNPGRASWSNHLGRAINSWDFHGVNVWFCPIWHRFWPIRTWDAFEGYWMSASFLDFGLRKICVRMFQGYPTVLDKNLKKGCWQHFHLVRRKSTIFKGHWFPRRDPPRLNPIPLFPHSLAHSGTTKKHNCWNPSWSIFISASTFIVFRHPFIHCIGKNRNKIAGHLYIWW